ncbi:MAG TPA: hypothetical protein VFW75_03680 [Acetobacteraceae bacterium]|nr:hypothetical protein [Acetobacteraceae bacterium]
MNKLGLPTEVPYLSASNRSGGIMLRLPTGHVAPALRARLDCFAVAHGLSI